MKSNPLITASQLRDGLLRSCLPAANHDPDQKFAWTNSICILFLLVGILGMRRGDIAIKPLPPLEEIMPVVVQPLTLPPQTETPQNRSSAPENQQPAPLVVVIPQAPNISFSVPTIGSLVVPANLAAAPPLEALQVQSQAAQLTTTGTSGERPAPPYPKLALQSGEQGTIVLLLTGDEAGNIARIEIKTPSGFPILDRAAQDFVKNHWRLPGRGLFETSITYQIQLQPN